MEALIAIILAILFWWKGGGGGGSMAGSGVRSPRPYPSGGTFYPPGYKADQNREPAWQREI